MIEASNNSQIDVPLTNCANANNCKNLFLGLKFKNAVSADFIRFLFELNAQLISFSALNILQNQIVDNAASGWGQNVKHVVVLIVSSRFGCKFNELSKFRFHLSDMTILETAVKKLQNDPLSQTLEIVAGAFKGFL